MMALDIRSDPESRAKCAKAGGPARCIDAYPALSVFIRFRILDFAASDDVWSFGTPSRK
jgi:hypothetical protein